MLVVVRGKVVKVRAHAAAAAVLCALILPSQVRSQAVTINATGKVLTSCGVAVASGFSMLDLSTAGSANANATVSCNAPFLIRAAATNKLFKNTKTAPSGFVNTLAYTFAATVPLDAPQTSVSASCTSSKLSTTLDAACAFSGGPGQGLSSGTGIASGTTATLTISWTPPVSPRLLAGSYTDTIVITVEPQQ